MSPKRLPRFAILLATSYCFAMSVSAQNQHDADEIADLIANAALCIYYPHFDAVTPDAMFNQRELAILESYVEPINLMIRAALGIGDSVCGAYFSQQFGLTQNLDLLRWHILEPGRFYGWEGSFRADGTHIYADDQYVYDSKYIAVAESLAGKPIYDVVQLTDDERAKILRIARDTSHESYEWALWILRKLRIL